MLNQTFIVRICRHKDRETYHHFRIQLGNHCQQTPSMSLYTNVMYQMQRCYQTDMSNSLELCENEVVDKQDLQHYRRYTQSFTNTVHHKVMVQQWNINSMVYNIFLMCSFAT